jgi:hypothetical protein
MEWKGKDENMGRRRQAGWPIWIRHVPTRPEIVDSTPTLVTPVSLFPSSPLFLSPFPPFLP